MSDISPSFTEFRRLASKGNVVPVYKTIVADLLSPVAAFLKLAPPNAGEPSVRRVRGKKGAYSFLLESVEGGERVGRYTFFGVDPFQVISCRGDRLHIARGLPGQAGSRTEEGSGNIFEFLRRTGSRFHSVPVPGLPPFTAGAVGYVSYGTVRLLERLPPRVAPDVELDDAIFMYFANVLAFDHVQHRLFLIANVLTEDGPGSLRAKYDAAVREALAPGDVTSPPAHAAAFPRAPRRLPGARQHDARTI